MTKDWAAKEHLCITAARLHNEGDQLTDFVVSIEFDGRWIEVIRECWAGGGISQIVEASGMIDATITQGLPPVRSDRTAVFEAALKSIAANSCCDRCQEAALVAKVALKTALPLKAKLGARR